MATTITKVKDGSITLPKEMKQAWKNAEVFMIPSGDSLFLKRVKKPSLKGLEKKLRQAGKLITDKDINEAVKWARKKAY